MDLDQGESIACFQELISSCNGEDHLILKQIAQLDIKCENVCHDFEKMAALLVESAASSSDDQQGALPDQTKASDNNNVQFSCTKNIHLLRGAWAHILRLDDCTKIHHRNAANYHQFYFEIREYDRCMDQSLPKLLAQVAKQRKDRSEYDGQTLLQQAKNIAFVLSFLQGKVYEMYERSRTVVPVQKRSDGSADGISVTALCAFKNKQIEVRQGDHLTLLKNKDVNVWTVKNGLGQIGDVPSPIVLIPPTDSKAIDAVFQLELKLLGHWVAAIKVLGKSILPYMDSHLSNWNTQKPDILRGLPTARKEELQQVLEKAQKTFARIWAKYPDYTKMNEEGAKLSKILKTSKGKGSSDNKAIKLTSETMGSLVATYQELLGGFAQFALWVRIGSMPERLLMVKGWEDYELQSLDDLVGKWQDYVLDEESASSDEDGEVNKTAITTEEPPAKDATDTASEKVEEQVTTSESCEQMKYVICGAADPWGGDDLDFETACKKGIINMERGLYYNPKTGERKPLGQAMAEGQVNVEVQYL